ncbi:carbohydrate kinase family protein [Leucobacter albus]|uniref:Carbohydrate kinase family protein n=1 Tax=Leucobacter albus TaxID=272210 RepID=A0ABW3TJJ3_9MICO
MSSGEALLVVSGYASVDFALQLAPFQGVDATTQIRGRADEWPRYGGIAHVTRAAGSVSAGGAAAGAAAGDSAGALRVAALSWVGEDAAGAGWIDAVAAGNAATTGIAVLGSRSPNAYLLYPEGDGTICLFDPGDCHTEGLSAAQRELLAGATTVVVTIGPERATRELLDAISAECTVFWVLKQDPDSLPADLATRLAGRADIVTLSEGESGYLATIAANARPGTHIVVTRGAAGSELRRVTGGAALETVGEVGAEPVRGVDTTGAGDTFSGTLAALIAGQGERDTATLLAHISEAAAATARMLAARA